MFYKQLQYFLSASAIFILEVHVKWSWQSNVKPSELYFLFMMWHSSTSLYDGISCNDFASQHPIYSLYNTRDIQLARCRLLIWSSLVGGGRGVGGGNLFRVEKDDYLADCSIAVTVHSNTCTLHYSMLQYTTMYSLHTGCQG